MTKVALVIDKRGSKFGFVLAGLLKKKYNVKLYDIHCFRKDKYFFKMKKELDYEPLIVREELESMVKNERIDPSYIKRLEEEYGRPYLWPYVWADRGIMSQHIKYSASLPGPSLPHEEILKRLQVYFREIGRALDEKKPDRIIFETVGSLDTDILSELAERRKIKVLHFSFPRIRNTTLFIDNGFDQFTEVYKDFDAIRQGLRKSSFKERAQKLLLEFRKSPSRYRYYIPVRAPLLKRVFLSITYFARALKTALNRNGKRGNFLNYFKNRLVILSRKIKGFSNILEQPRAGEDFAYFPLHFEPETATMLFAPFFTNQIALIQNIAKSLPIAFKLYVKEHPDMVNRRPASYYKELKKLPNVRLINHEIDSIFLIKKSRLVLTITGTVGWEAAMLSKPVITFGQAFYNKLSSVKSCRKPEDLPLAIKEGLESQPTADGEMVDFISAILENSINFDYSYIWLASVEEITKYEKLNELVEALARKLELLPVNEV